MQKRTLILVDAGWFCLAIGANIIPKTKYPTADIIYHNIVSICTDDEELEKILYYDTIPFNGTIENPISRTGEDYSKSKPAIARTQFLDQIMRKDKIALRRGKIMFRDWKLRKEYLNRLIKGEPASPLHGGDIQPDFQQKGVDMKIGLDMASIAYKHLAERIILLSADTDMVPAMKLARTEGIQIVTIKVGSWDLSDELIEHSDFVRKYSPRFP